MSRPFSYNDENFTVIGNVLFVHVAISDKAYAGGRTICTIPQAIFSRMITYNQQSTISNNLFSTNATSMPVFCNKDGNLIMRNGLDKLTGSSRFVITWFYLKDI